MKPVGIEATNFTIGESDPTLQNQVEPGLFKGFVSTINQDQHNADQAIQDFMSGKSDNIQHVVSQMVKSELSFHFFMEVRNQVMESYNEIMRMQV